jgi:anti-sigma factor RsiW
VARDEFKFDRECCPVEDLAAYIDRELPADREAVLESHLAECPECLADLNSQKMFLSELNARLGGDVGPEPPADFARIVSVRAESSVCGLKGHSEGVNAFFVVIALGLSALFLSGIGSNQAISWTMDSVDKSSAIANTIFHFISTAFISVSVILRSLAIRLPVNASMAIVGALLASGTLALYSFRRSGSDRV